MMNAFFHLNDERVTLCVCLHKIELTLFGRRHNNGEWYRLDDATGKKEYTDQDTCQNEVTNTD
jgi:hypothetical protein